MGDRHADMQQAKWYALFVRSNQEKRVAEALRGREVEHFLPCYYSVRQWKDRRVKLEIPLFPGYVFVHLPLADRAKALSVPRVVSLVGGRNLPSAVSDKEISWIKLGVEQGRAEPYPYLMVGQHVVVTEGIMSGMEGVLVRKRNATRVVVSLDSIARAFVVEIDAACVKPVGTCNTTATAAWHKEAFILDIAPGGRIAEESDALSPMEA
jgi:transcription antitermination factor NusG